MWNDIQEQEKRRRLFEIWQKAEDEEIDLIGRAAEASKITMQARKNFLSVLANPVGKGMTRREKQVFGLIKLGLQNKEIAAKLKITERTVKAHVGSLLAKYGVTNRRDLCEQSENTNSPCINFDVTDTNESADA